MPDYVIVFPSPMQSITQSSDTLFAIAGAASYQWYFNGSMITGSTNYFHIAIQNGNYNVVATDSNGCEVEAAILNVTANLQSVVGSSQLAIFPNPVEETLNVIGYMLYGTADDLSIYNVLGEKMLLPLDEGSLTIDCRSLQSGLYFIEFRNGENNIRTRFLKQ